MSKNAPEPKSGWRLRVPPLLMKEMYEAEPASTGQEVMSRFHQFVAGKSGKGPGRAPLATGPRPAAPADAVQRAAGSVRPAAIRQPMRIRAVRRFFRDILPVLSRVPGRGANTLPAPTPGLGSKSVQEG